MNEKLKAALKAWDDAIEAGDLELAKTKRAEAEAIKSLMAERKALGELEAEYAPVRPNLPGVSTGALPQVAEAKAVAEVKVEEEKSSVDSAKSVAYQRKFGTEHEAVKGILKDLHGADYQSQYWAQKTAFNKYIRGGEQAITSDQQRLLKGIVLTPQAVKMSLDQGVDDLAVIKAMMVEASDTLGGFLVPVDFQMRVIEQIAQMTIIRQRASKMNTSRDRVEMPEATGGNGRYTSPVRVTWVDETPTVGQITPNYVTFGLRGINVHTAMAEAPLSRNFLDDIAFDIEGYLSEKLAESVSLDEDEQFIKGNGIGKPRGILPNLANANSITEVVSGNSSALTWNGLMGMTYGIPAQYRQDGVWLANRNTYLAIAKMQDSTSGNYLWQAYQYEGGEGGRTRTLLGYPIVENEVMPDIAAGAYPLLFGDLGSYTIVDRLGMTVERFIGAQEARQNLVYFVMRRRVGGDLVENWKLVAQRVSS